MYSEPTTEKCVYKQDSINKMDKCTKEHLQIVFLVFVCLWTPTLPNKTNYDRSLGSFSRKIIRNSPMLFGSTTVQFWGSS